MTFYDPNPQRIVIENYSEREFELLEFKNAGGLFGQIISLGLV